MIQELLLPIAWISTFADPKLAHVVKLVDTPL
jgi:hypothetical protein